MERYTMLMDLKNQYCQNDCSSKGSLQIQCKLYHITQGIFHSTRKKSLKICMETQKTADKPLESWKRKMEPQESGSLTSDYTTKLQLSKEYDTGTKIKS